MLSEQEIKKNDKGVEISLNPCFNGMLSERVYGKFYDGFRGS